jgi:hypothetical protein
MEYITLRAALKELCEALIIIGMCTAAVFAFITGMKFVENL